MFKNLFFAGLFALALALAPGCAALKKSGGLSVDCQGPIIYDCGEGGQVQARYCRLSDNSLEFVRLTMPDGKQYTLPRVVSGSGARYSDGMELVWWIKGETAFTQVRGKDGQWETQLNCAETPPEK